MAGNHVIDRLLVVRAQAGDEKAFTLLVRRWNPKLLGFAYKLSGDRQAARDIAQETWAGVVKGLRRLDDPALFKAWIFRIANNKAADDIRARQKHRKTEQTAKEMAHLENTETHPEDHLTLKNLVAAMAPERRALIILFYLEGLTIPELAEVFDIPAGTVKSRLFKAREDLKHAYERKAS